MNKKHESTTIAIANWALERTEPIDGFATPPILNFASCAAKVKFLN